jgi:hypothetical protein
MRSHIRQTKWSSTTLDSVRNHTAALVNCQLRMPSLSVAHDMSG